MIDTYAAWAAYHARLFGLTGQADADMVLDWCELFESHGYSVAELLAASRWLAVNDPPPRWGHLAGIKTAIFLARSRAQEQQRRQQQALEAARYRTQPAPPPLRLGALLKGIGQQPDTTR